MVADPRPARLTVPDRAAQLQIQGQINSWLEGPPVVLEDQAFAAYHRVTLVPASGRALDRPNGVDGRRVGAPEQFDLLLAGGQCLLRRVRTGATVPLTAVHCEPEPAAD